MPEDRDELRARQQIMDLVADYYDKYMKQDESFAPGDRIPYGGRVFGREEVLSLVDSALDFWLTAGKYADRFEREFSDKFGSPYVSLVGSGSSANLLAFMALTAPELGGKRIKRGDEVITVACGFPTTVSPIVQYGAVPVFADVEKETYNIDVSELDAALSPRTKAVFIAHTLGNPFDIKAVKEFCIKNDLWLVEDNCDALGSEYTLDGETSYTGTFGHISTCSFYPAHHITMGEGGLVCTNDPLLHRLIRSYRDWGRDCVCPPGQDNFCGHRFDGEFGSLPKGYDHKYVYSHLGYNLKATDMQAAVGCAQLEKIDSFIEKRRHNWERLYKGLEKYEEVLILPKETKDSTPSWFGFGLCIKEGAQSSKGTPLIRDEVTGALEKMGIQTRLFFGGNLTRQPCFESLEEGVDYRIASSLKNTDFIMNNAFWLGVYPGLTDEKTDYIIDAIGKVL